MRATPQHQREGAQQERMKLIQDEELQGESKSKLLLTLKMPFRNLGETFKKAFLQKLLFPN
jgi:hypothetical protein